MKRSLSGIKPTGNLTLGNYIGALKNFKESSDMYNYAIQAHSLKSDARYLGFTRLAELSFAHENAGKENNVSYVYDNFDSLIEEANRIIKVICSYKGEDNIEENIIKEEEKHFDKVILVVDDSDIVRNYVKKMFDDEYEIKQATDGENAINIIKSDLEERIVGMLLDLNMPKVDGFAVLDYFDKHNLFVRVPVAIITGAEDKEDITKAFMYPIIDVLNKPFNEKNVKSVIEKMIVR